MPTLVLPPRRSDDTRAVEAAALNAGWQVEVASGWRLPDPWNLPQPVLYGDVLFCDVAAGPLAISLLEPPLDWLTAVPPAYLRRRVAFSTLAAARLLTEPLFCKPADDKCFPAQVYKSGAELPDDGLLPEETPVLISEPVVWEVEYRCFVVDRQVVTFSAYLRRGELLEDAGWTGPADEQSAAQAFASSALADSTMAVPPAFVLDVGRVEGRGWAIIEANPAWGAGVYGCRAADLLPVLARASVSRAHLSDQDAPWSRPFRAVEY